MPASQDLVSLRCRELAAYPVDELESVRRAFAVADGCTLQQAWREAPETDFLPATVRAGWHGNSLRIFAELQDRDIFSRASAHNQYMWELGDVLEIFLQPDASPGYIELHVTPDNFRLQLRFPDSTALQRAQATNRFEDLLLPDGVFQSRTWKEPGRWSVHAEIPAALVAGAPDLPPEVPWRFSFSRYDYTRGRSEPVISSSSPHALPNFHRRQEWGTLVFHRKDL